MQLGFSAVKVTYPEGDEKFKSAASNIKNFKLDINYKLLGGNPDKREIYYTNELTKGVKPNIQYFLDRNNRGNEVETKLEELDKKYDQFFIDLIKFYSGFHEPLKRLKAEYVSEKDIYKDIWDDLGIGPEHPGNSLHLPEGTEYSSCHNLQEKLTCPPEMSYYQTRHPERPCNHKRAKPKPIEMPLYTLWK